MAKPSRHSASTRRVQGLRLLAILTLLLPPLVAQALPEDRDQPIRITADTAIRDEKQGFTVYEGNVVMVQGSLEIEADRLTIFHAQEQADKIIAEGLPAKMQQIPAIDEPLMRARAEIIEYYKLEDRVHLKIDAYIDQDGASVTGESIDYFITEQLVKADSGGARAGNRVQVVIPAQVVREEETVPDTAGQGEASESVGPAASDPNNPDPARMVESATPTQEDAASGNPAGS